MFIGSNENFDDAFQGNLDNIAIFREALTLEQIESVRWRALFPEKVRVISSRRISWPTLSGRIYHLERSEDFTQWNEIAAPYIGDGQEKMFDMSLQGTQGFYRLRFE